MTSANPRALYAEALSALLRGEMAKVALERNFVLLAEIARLAQSDAPIALAATDPALYSAWRAAVTRFHVSGWTQMTPSRVAQVAALGPPAQRTSPDDRGSEPSSGSTP